MLVKVENSHIEKIAKLEKEKLRIVQEAEKYKKNSLFTPVSGDPNSPNSKRRNKFRSLL